MGVTFYKIALGLMLVVVVVLSLALYVSHRRMKEQSPIVETPVLRQSAVRLEPRKTNYDMIVWNRTKLSSGGFDTHDIFQIRIEAKTDNDEHTFEWPNEDSCAPEGAELRDVGRTGWMEFVIYCTPDVRILRFDGTQFVFRSSMDQLHNVLGPSRFDDLDRDGVSEYIAVLNFPQRFGDPKNLVTVPVPVIYRWSPENGFREVSGLFPEFYRKKAVSDLRKQQQGEPNAARRQLFDKAIEYIEKQLASKTPSMAPVS